MAEARDEPEDDVDENNGEDESPPPAPAPPGGDDRARLRRWHSLSGGVALGVFLAEHLLVNASALGGDARFDGVVGSIERLAILPILELVFIVLPLAVHVGIGIKLLRSSSTPDREMDRYGDRRLWVVQRGSGTVVLAFMLAHLWEFRVQRLLFGLDAAALHTKLIAHLSWTWFGVPWVALLYVIGIGATTFHFSNGLFAATDAWGVWPATRSGGRRAARAISSGLGLVFFLIGTVTVIGIATGTRLLPAPDADSAPCGSVVPAASAVSPPSR